MDFCDYNTCQKEFSSVCRYYLLAEFDLRISLTAILAGKDKNCEQELIE